MERNRIVSNNRALRLAEWLRVRILVWRDDTTLKRFENDIRREIESSESSKMARVIKRIRMRLNVTCLVAYLIPFTVTEKQFLNSMPYDNHKAYLHYFD